jgi:hypothetical protein
MRTLLMVRSDTAAIANQVVHEDYTFGNSGRGREDERTVETAGHNINTNWQSHTNRSSEAA